MTAMDLGIVMDPIQTVNVKKDSSIAMLLEAARRGFHLHYFEQKALMIRDGKAYGKSRLLRVFDRKDNWFELGEETMIELASLDMMLMRKDPPFDLEYIYTTYILELAERAGLRVINKPQSLRDFNEKVFTSLFPQCCPPTVVTRDKAVLREFLLQYGEIVVKPLEGMGGASVFRLHQNDVNASVVFEVLTHHESRFVMAQQYIPEIVTGDKRILMLHGEPVPYALLRIPAPGEFRGNLAAGGKGVAQPLSARDRWICHQVGPVLKEKGLYFVGLDVIGDYLTEINITSPTGIRQLDEQCGINISAMFFDALV